MKSVQVFRKDISDQYVAANIVLVLKRYYSHCRINFDLEDCDKIRRIESWQNTVEEAVVQGLVAGYGYHCEPLQD